MNDKKYPSSRPIDAAHIATLKALGKPLFSLGRIYATPACFDHLLKHNMLPPALLAFHCMGEFGELDKEDVQTNERAILDGGRILSSYLIEGEKIYVITEAVDESGARHTTTMLFASEY